VVVFRLLSFSGELVVWVVSYFYFPLINSVLVLPRILDTLGDDGLVFPLLLVFGIKVLFVP